MLYFYKTMKQTIKDIRDDLSELYPKEEIDSFIFLIFNHIYGFRKIDLLISPDFDVSIADNAKISDWVDRLKKYEPIQYVLGVTEFYGLKFRVTEDVLIPRQETEELVDLIVKRYRNFAPKILDIGSGSGCIPIALKKNLPMADVWSCDISPDALSIARENAELNSVDVSFSLFDILSSDDFPATGFDVIVSNPPYVTEREKALMHSNVLDYEPHLALFVTDQEPLLFYNNIVKRSKKLLKNDGAIFFEINEAYGLEVKSLLADNGFDAEIVKDINGKDRIVHGWLK